MPCTAERELTPFSSNVPDRTPFLPFLPVRALHAIGCSHLHPHTRRVRLIANAADQVQLGETAMTMVVKEIDSRSAGRIVGALGAVLALLGSVIVAVLAAATAIAGSQGPNLIFALATLLWAPVVYGLGGYLAGWWLAAFYNLGADLVGGLKLELAPATPEENASHQ